MATVWTYELKMAPTMVSVVPAAPRAGRRYARVNCDPTDPTRFSLAETLVQKGTAAGMAPAAD